MITDSGRRFFGSDFVSEGSGSNASGSNTPEHLKANTTHGGAPVSINESRDISKPYQDTLGGKKLVYVPGKGAVFVNENQLPPKKETWRGTRNFKLSY